MHLLRHSPRSLKDLYADWLGWPGSRLQSARYAARGYRRDQSSRRKVLRTLREGSARVVARMDLAGGPPLTIFDGCQTRGAAWSDEGQINFRLAVRRTFSSSRLGVCRWSRNDWNQCGVLDPAIETGPLLAQLAALAKALAAGKLRLTPLGALAESKSQVPPKHRRQDRRRYQQGCSTGSTHASATTLRNPNRASRFV
jgi:hypothetical protein